MKKVLVSAIVASGLVAGVNAFDFGEIGKSIKKGKELTDKVGITEKQKTKSWEEIYKDNTESKTNIETCKKFYHTHKIAFYGKNDIVLLDTAQNNMRVDRDNYEKWEEQFNAQFEAKKLLEQQNFDINKYTKKKTLLNHAVCKTILAEGLSRDKNDAFEKFEQETKKYDK